MKEREVEGRPSYTVLNDPKAGELEIEEEVERVAKGLFSVIVTMSAQLVVYAFDSFVMTLVQASSQSFGVRGEMRRRW